MRLLKKFNQYMLENHPLTWHSKFIQLMLAGILFWVISYACGYAMVDLGTIQYETISRYYTRSTFVSFHVIYCLVIVCLWAIFFYKNNAIKSFYPLQRFYLARIFVQLFVAFSLLVSADIPFTMGCFAKVRAILPEEQVENDIDKLNTGAAFLAQTLPRYHFDQRKEVRLLNYSYVKFDHVDNKWEDNFDYYYAPEYNGGKYAEKGLYRDIASRKDSVVTDIDGKKYLFFSQVQKFTTPDSCNSIQLITGFHSLNYIQDLHLYHINNYSYPDFNYLHAQHYKDFQKERIAEIHAWAANNRKDSITRAIREFMAVCDKYDISYDLNPELVATYLEAKNYMGMSSFTYGYASKRNKLVFSERYPELYAMIRKYTDGQKVEQADRESLVNAMESQDFFFYDPQRLTDMISNYQDAYWKNLFKDLLPILILGFFMAWLFVFFEFANIISLLISIPIGGVLAILVAIALVYINMMMSRSAMYNYENGFDHHMPEKVSIAIVFCVCLLILLTTIFGLFRKRFNKRVLNILINLSYCIVPGFIGLLFGMVNIFSGHDIASRCDEYYEYSYSYLLEPGLMLVYAFIGVFSFFPAVAKWRAKEE